VGFELTIVVFEWAKTVHASDLATTEIGMKSNIKTGKLLPGCMALPLSFLRKQTNVLY
jgi:hypothetical protein